jgi:hypothetical protein
VVSRPEQRPPQGLQHARQYTRFLKMLQLGSTRVMTLTLNHRREDASGRSPYARRRRAASCKDLADATADDGSDGETKPC